MAEFSIKGVTNAGATIFGNADTAHKIVFVKALSSTNDVSLSDILQMNTVDPSAWDGPNGVVVSDLTNVVNDVARITVRFPHQNQEYRIKTVAVTAQLANVTDPVETIISVQSDPNKTLFIPSGSSIQDSVYVRFNITINNSSPTAVVTPGLYASIGDYNSLNERAVTTHSKEDASTGDDQDILGEKHFNNNTIFSEGILVKDQGVADIRLQTKAQDIIPQGTLMYSLGDIDTEWSSVYAANFKGTATDAINLSFKSDYAVDPKLTATSSQVTSKTHIIPDTDKAYDLGTTQNAWNTLYCDRVGTTDRPVESMYLSYVGTTYGIELAKDPQFPKETILRTTANTYCSLGDSTHRYYKVYAQTLDAANSIYTAGSVSIAGSAVIEGSVDIRSTLSVSGTITSYNIKPLSHGTYDLGSFSQPWKNIYTGRDNSYYICIGYDSSITDSSSMSIKPSITNCGHIGTPNLHWYKAYINNIYVGTTSTDLSTYIENTTVTNATNAAKVYVYTTSSNADYPVILRSPLTYNTAAGTSDNRMLYMDSDNKITYNPYTNTLRVGNIHTDTIRGNIVVKDSSILPVYGIGYIFLIHLSSVSDSQSYDVSISHNGTNYYYKASSVFPYATECMTFTRLDSSYTLIGHVSSYVTAAAGSSSSIALSRNHLFRSNGVNFSNSIFLICMPHFMSFMDSNGYCSCRFHSSTAYQYSDGTAFKAIYASGYTSLHSTIKGGLMLVQRIS